MYKEKKLHFIKIKIIIFASEIKRKNQPTLTINHFFINITREEQLIITANFHKFNLASAVNCWKTPTTSYILTFSWNFREIYTQTTKWFR